MSNQNFSAYYVEIVQNSRFLQVFFFKIFQTPSFSRFTSFLTTLLITFIVKLVTVLKKNYFKLILQHVYKQKNKFYFYYIQIYF